MALILTGKRQVFVEQYIKHGNIKQAMREAGYSENTRSTLLMRDDRVRTAIAEQRKKQLEQSGIDGKAVIAEVASIAFDEKVRMPSRLRALDMLAKSLGLYEPEGQGSSGDVNVTVVSQIPRNPNDEQNYESNSTQKH